jgi:hypothetical protein
MPGSYRAFFWLAIAGAASSRNCGQRRAHKSSEIAAGSRSYERVVVVIQITNFIGLVSLWINLDHVPEVRRVWSRPLSIFGGH